MQDKITIEHGGTVHQGHYSVKGTNTREITVYYHGIVKCSDFDHRAEQPGYVESMAAQILEEIIVQEETQLLSDTPRLPHKNK